MPANIDQFAADWSLPVDEMRLWTLAQEMIGHTLFGFEQLCEPPQFAGAAPRRRFPPDASAVAEHLSSLEVGDADPMAAMQQLLSDPALLLAPCSRRSSSRWHPQLDAAIAAVVGSVDYLVDAVSARVVGGDALRIAEAVRRRRFEASPDDLFVEADQPGDQPELGVRLDELLLAAHDGRHERGALLQIAYVFCITSAANASGNRARLSAWNAIRIDSTTRAMHTSWITNRRPPRKRSMNGPINGATQERHEADAEEQQHLAVPHRRRC